MDSEDTCAGASPWLGGGATPEAGFRQRPASQRRIALPGLAQVGAGGLDRLRMEAQREQPPGQVLPLDATGPQATRKGGGQLGSALRRHLACGATRGGLRDASRTLVLHRAAETALLVPPPASRAGVGRGVPVSP